MVPVSKPVAILANSSFQFVSSVVPSALTERGLALLVKPVLLRTPTIERNASDQAPSPQPEPRAPMEVSATVPLAVFVLPLARPVQERLPTIVLSALLARTSSTEAALALMEMAFAPVLA